jgi:phytoene dehydrogenase-like protein
MVMGARRMRYRLRAFGLDLPLSGSFDTLVAAYGEAFSHDAPGIKRFFDEVVAIVGHLKGGGENPLRGIADLLPLPAAVWIDRLVVDPRLRRILGSQGTAEPYAGVPLTAAMWDLIAGEEGIVLPEGGIGLLAKLLLAAIREAGGEVRLGVPVGRIKVLDGHVAGVVTAAGEEIPTETVISNADVKTTVLRLLAAGDAPGNWRDAVAGAPLTGSVLQVCLGVDPHRADLSAFDAADRVIFRSAGGEESAVDWGALKVDPAALARGEMEVALWRREGDSASIVIRVPAEHAHFARFRHAPGRRNPAYAGYKGALAAALTTAAEEVVPNLASAALVTDVATPLTFEERGGRWEGSVAGWSWDFGGVDDGRPRDFVITPVAGLYFSGCQARSALFLGGVPTALVSGVAAAEAVIGGEGPEEPRVAVSRPHR